MPNRKTKPRGYTPFEAQYGPRREIREYKIVDAVAAMEPVTVRQAFYGLVSQGIVDKTQTHYQKVSQVLSDARRGGLIDWGQIWSDDPDVDAWFDDHADDIDKVSQYVDEWVNQMLSLDLEFHVGEAHDQQHQVFVIVEHRSLVPQLDKATRDSVKVLSGGGQPSTTLLHDFATELRGCDSPVVLTLSDRDADGEAIARWWVEDITAFGVQATWEHIGLTPEQVAEFDLPSFNGKTQIEALPPAELRKIVYEATEKWFDSSVDEANDKLREEGQAEMDKVAEPIRQALQQYYDDHLA